MTKKLLTTCIALCLTALGAMAQTTTTASSSMTVSPWAETIPYNIGDQGKKINFVAGMGGWSDIQFAYKQRNWVGTEHINIARVGFIGENNTSRTEPTSLTNAQKSSIDTELNKIAPTGATNLLLLCDMSNSSGSVSSSNWTSTNVTHKRRRTNYVKQMELAVQYIESKGYTVVAVAPFNEPDYDALGTSGKSAKAFNAVAEVMQSNSTLKGRVFGPNTLNNSNAVSWYNTVKGNINFINTHQLDGTFSDLIKFWDTGISEGKQALADEMHNVLEAMVAMNHGAKYGTWWAYEGVARAEFSRMTSMGSQLAYKEDISNWAVAGVYRYENDANKAKAIIGTSERNALPSKFTYLSKGRLAYYDGYGPTYDYTEEVPGGTAYWENTPNAERVINIYTGEDVPIEPANGTYKLVNKASGKVLSPRDGSLFDAVRICQYTDGTVGNQTWNIQPVANTIGGDYSYHYITNANTSGNTFHLDDLDWSLDEGKEVIAYPGGGSGCEQWHIRYVGEGYYTIINRHSGLCLEVLDGNTANAASVVQKKVDENNAQLWKLVPANHAVDATAPAVPTGLKATAQSGSVKLTWTANSDSDIYGHMVYRYNNPAGTWECIGRKVQGTTFIDNTCRKGQTLRYRIKALDQAYNLSAASAEVETKTSASNALVGQWMAYSWDDNTENRLNAVPYSTTLTNNEGKAAFSFDGTDDYIKLPYHVGDMQQMTFAAWVKGSSTTAWQRIFDFGNGEDEYLFLTPTNGSTMRFEIKKNGTTQGLNATTTFGTGKWKHVAVTIGANEVAIYIDGVKNVSSSSITLRPSDVAPTISYLGRSQFDADPAFNGMMSDVRIYNYALSDNEIVALTTASVSPEDVEAATSSATAEAIELLKQPMSASVRDALQQAIDKVNSAAEAYIAKIEDETATSNDGTNWSNALKALTNGNQIANARASIEVYKELASQIAIARATAEANSRQYGIGTFNTALSTIEKGHNEGAYADSEIAAAIIEVKGITNRYLMADAVALATEANPVDVTFMVSNPSFDGDSYASWTTNTTPNGVSYNSVEFWNTNYNIYQVLIGMPAGTYRFQTRGFYRYGYQDNNLNAYNNRTLERHAKLYITHEKDTQTADVMAISDDPSSVHEWGNWYNASAYGWVPDNMQAASEAIDVRERYVPRDGLNSVTFTATKIGDLTIGAKKETLIDGDWSFFSDFSLYYLGDGEHTLELNEEKELPQIDESIVYEIVSVTRSFKANKWNTFVVPFNMEIPDGWEVKELERSESKSDNITLMFKDAENIKAGVPYMVHAKKFESGFKVSTVEVTTTPSNTETEDVIFTGTYEKTNIPQGAFFISDNTFYYAADNSNKIKPFRAYIMPKSNSANARSLSYRTDDETDITEEIAEEVTVVAIYNLRGMRLDDMQEGVNILQMSDGSVVKVVIK